MRTHFFYKIQIKGLEVFMKKYLLYVFLQISLLIFSFNAMGSGSTGGGDNLSRDSGAAWYYDTSKTIKICFSISPDFGLNEETIKKDVQSAFKMWDHYFLTKGICSEFPDEQKFTTKIELLTQCNGKEDLTIYAGVTNDTVEAYKKNFHNPTAFVARTKLDLENLWAKGFIWLAKEKSVILDGITGIDFPDWNIPGNLTAMLLHEIGHIYGNEHVEETIMMSDMAKLLMYDNYFLKMRIDTFRELYRCNSCEKRYTGLIDESDKANTFLLFAQISGHNLPNNSIISLRKEANSKNYILSLYDDLNSFRDNLTFEITDERSSKESASIFKHINGSQNYTTSNIVYGFVVGKNGNKFPLVLEDNFSNGNGLFPPRLIGFLDGKKVVIAKFYKGDE